jgi:hypothetical protein
MTRSTILYTILHPALFAHLLTLDDTLIISAKLRLYSHSRAFHSPILTCSSPNGIDGIQMQVTDSKELIKQAFLDGELLIASNGSYKEDLSTWAHIITFLLHRDQQFLTGTTSTTGPANMRDSYWAKLPGIVATCHNHQVLIEQCDLQKVPTTITTVGCENLADLRVCCNIASHPNVSPDHDHYNI